MEYNLSDNIEVQSLELFKVHKGLQLIEEDGSICIKGSLPFSATLYGTCPIVDCYNIKIHIPTDYPNKPPTTTECDGRIPRTFHTNPDGTLCLGSPLEVRMKFKGSLLNYVQKLIIPFLYSFSFYEKYGKLPYGELSHGSLGIVESYKELFGVSDSKIVLGLLNILARGKYRGHHDCPCGSKKRLRNCHGSQLLDLMNYQSKDEFMFDLNQCSSVIRKGRDRSVSNQYSRKS